MTVIKLKYPLDQSFFAHVKLHDRQRKWCTEQFGPEGIWKDELAIEDSYAQLYLTGVTCWYFANEEDAVLFALRWA